MRHFIYDGDFFGPLRGPINWLTGGGMGVFLDSCVVVAVHRPALLILTLFQGNIYKVNVREYSLRIYVVKMNTINY